jgi:hypothetical protein
VNIDWVIPCRYVEVHDNLGTIIGAGIDTFWVPEIPSPIQVLLAIRLLALSDELDGRPHAAVTRIRAPGGDVVSEVGGDVSIGAANAHAEWLNGIMVAGVVQFEASEAGTFMIEFEVDEASESLPLHVVHGLPPGHTLPEN